jgi:F-type H+-transporting ATPase subunit delta
MRNVNIVRKYVKALSDISVDNKKEKICAQDLKNVLEVFKNSEELSRCLYSFNVPKSIKINIVQDIFSSKIDYIVLNFLILLIKNNRLYLLKNICDGFENITYKNTNVIKLIIISAANLDESTISKISEKYKKIYNASGVITILSIDKTLIGGVKVIMSDNVIDDSVKYKLKKLQEVLGGL